MKKVLFGSVLVGGIVFDALVSLAILGYLHEVDEKLDNRLNHDFRYETNKDLHRAYRAKDWGI